MASTSFHSIPDSAERTWTLTPMNLTATPIGNNAMDTTYESPIREITLGVQFLSSNAIENLRYVLDEGTFVPEWEFAQESWEHLVEGITEVITKYNQSVIARARELGLNSITAIGRAKTIYNADRDSMPETPIRRATNPEYGSSRVETVYEPSVRSVATSRRSAAVKMSPLQAWITNTRVSR